MTKYLWKDQIIEEDDLRIDLHDRGYQFGDGLYEVVHLYNGNFFTLDEHLDRLARGAADIMLNLNYSKEEIKDLVKKLADANEVTNGYVYIQITRGEKKLRNHGFDFYADQKPVLSGFAVSSKRKTKMYEEGTTGISVPDKRWKMCNVKSLNLIPNVLAKHMAQMKNVSKAIFVRDGVVTEEKSGNVLMIKDGMIYSHPDGDEILPGITKMLIKKIALEHSIPYIERTFTIEELRDADEIMITDTNSECAPLIELDGITIGAGKPGELSKTIQKYYEEEIIQVCGALE